MAAIGTEIWLATAWGLVAIGVVVALWALLGDWYRIVTRTGRKARCSRCWYDMTDITANGNGAWVCPECGREFKDARQFHRVRRRWWWAASSIAVFALAWCAWCVPDVQQRGWWGIAPRPVLIVMLPRVDAALNPVPGAAFNPPPSAYQELTRRLFRPDGQLVTLVAPERWLLWNRALATIASDDSSSAAKALAAKALVRLHDDAVEHSEGAGKGFVIVARMERAYAKANSFRCRGTVFGNIGARDETPFLIAMERPDKFRFEFLSGHPHETTFSMRFVAWQNMPGEAYDWWTIRPQVQLSPDLSMPLAAGTGISAGSAHVVPSMLLPGVFKSSRFGQISGPVLVTRATFNNRPCWRVEVALDARRQSSRTRLRGVLANRGALNDSAGEVLWIDADTYMLLRFDDFLAHTTVFSPELDVAVDKSWFTFDPAKPDASPLQDAGRQPRPGKE